MLTASPGWKSFCKRIPVNAGKESIYAAWSSAAALEQWFLRKALFTGPTSIPKPRDETIREGDRFQWFWHGHPDDVTEKNEIFAANGDLLRFGFTSHCVVTVSILTEDGEN